MVDDVKNITENAESKVSAEALDRARLARERREAEQRKRLDELRAHAAAAQAQRERRDEERRRRQSEQRNRDDDRRTQVEERKRAIWEASISRREALLQREREREERLERARASRSTPRSAFAFGSSTPRLLEPVDTTGFFWAARSTNPIDQMNFYESLASSTTNVMFASAPLTRRASALHLDSDNDPKDEPDRQPPPAMWSSVARRRTDLVPTLPASRGPETRSGDSTPGSRPGSALSNATTVVRRATSAPRRPRPASIAGGGDQGQSVATTPGVSRDGSSTNMGGGGDVPRRHPSSTPRRVRPMSVHDPSIHVPMTSSGGVTDGKPPLHRKPKLSKDHEKTPRGKSLSVSPGRLSASLSPAVSKESSVDKEVKPKPSSIRNLVNPTEVSQKLEALQIKDADTAKEEKQSVDLKVNENKEPIVNKPSSPIEQANVTQENTQDVPKTMENGEKPVLPEKSVVADKPVLPEKPVEKVDKKEERKTEKVEEKRDTSAEKNDESEMTASMSAKRITTEEEAKAALAERRKKAREELEKQAELERQRLQREAEEEEERQRQEEERQRREEEEARELARLQRSMEEDKLRKAIEAQQQLEREEAERKAQEEIDKQTRLREEEEKRKALEEELRQKREEAEREEKERLARKQRVEAIMARTRLKKAEEDKKQDIKPQSSPAPSQAESQTPGAPAASDEPVPTNGNEKVNNGNAGNVADLLGFGSSGHSEEPKGLLDASITASESNSSASLESNPAPNNGNVTADLLGLSEQNNTEDKPQEQMIANSKPQIDNTTTNVQPALETNNGNLHSVPSPTSNVGHISANFIQTERLSAEQSKDKSKFNEEDFTSHNGHNATLNHPLTLQNAI